MGRSNNLKIFMGPEKQRSYAWKSPGNLFLKTGTNSGGERKDLTT